MKKYTKRIFEQIVTEYEEAKQAYKTACETGKGDLTALAVRMMIKSNKYDEMMVDLLLEDDTKFEVVI